MEINRVWDKSGIINDNHPRLQCMKNKDLKICIISTLKTPTVIISLKEKTIYIYMQYYTTCSTAIYFFQ